MNERMFPARVHSGKVHLARQRIGHFTILHCTGRAVTDAYHVLDDVTCASCLARAQREGIDLSLTTKGA